MVGVPSLDLCQRGPISKIFCPILTLFKTGIKTLASITVRTKHMPAPAKISVMFLHSPLKRYILIFVLSVG